MELPDQLKFKAILVQGGAFKTQFASDEYPRYYFVINKNPAEVNTIILITSTTHFELHRDCPDGDDVHIVLSPRDYDEFTKKCLICCNWRPRILPKEKLLSIISKKEYVLLKPLPKNLLKKNSKRNSKKFNN